MSESVYVGVSGWETFTFRLLFEPGDVLVAIVGFVVAEYGEACGCACDAKVRYVSITVVRMPGG